MFHVPEHLRIQPPRRESNVGDNFGCFRMNSPSRKGFILFIVASNGEHDNDWQHVSVHASTVLGINYTPSWEEMCKVKDLFWDEEDTVIQYHPPKSQYVNMHKATLHLWSHPSINFPMPPMEYV